MSIDPVSLAISAAVAGINMAVTASRTIEGPRLKDTSATVADYGTPLNYVLGQRVISCPCFFAKPIQEVKKKRKGKGGKAVDYSGFATWAAHIADHEIVGIGKIWFDNHLVYDATGSEEKLYPLSDDYELEANLRIYLGTPDQEPDPDMEAYIEARDGPGTCPAYRDTAYAYFENVPVEQLGNRFPTVTMLIRTASPRAFDGWYARARIVLVNPSTTLPGLGFYVNPSGPAQTISNVSSGVWPGTSNSEFPGGIPYRVYDAGNHAVTLYWCEESAMDALEIDLRLQFPNGSVSAEMMASFSWEFWNTGPASPSPVTSTIINPGDTSSTSGNPFDVYDLFTGNWYFPVLGSDSPPGSYDAGNNSYSNIETLLKFVSEKVGLDPADYNWSATRNLVFGGYNWTQGSGRQVLEPVLDLFDVDVRPHDFGLEALPRGNPSEGAIATGDMVRTDDGPPYALKDIAPGDLPRRIYLVYADVTTDQNPNVAMPPGPSSDAAGTVREISIDMQTMALEPDDAQRLAERSLRRARFGRMTGEFSVTRQHLAIEPGDVWTPEFDERAWSMRNTKLNIGANGVVSGEWERDTAALAVLSSSAGAPATGFTPDVVPDDLGALGFVMDLPLLIDAHEQSAPLAYLTAGPDAPGVWTGADFAQSETGELDSYATNWDGIAAGDGSVIGEVAEVMPDAVLWVPDMGTVITVTINAGELTAATLDELMLDPTLNLAAIRSGAGWELVQFMTPTLVDTLEYTLTGFLRGVRGTEWAMAGHQAGDDFILLDSAKRHTMGAGELGDTDWYIAAPTGQSPNQDNAFSVTYTGASHKPYSAVDAEISLDGDDVLFDATRRTRIGGATLDGQDVPLGETAESWSLDILDTGVSPVAVKRTLTGSSLPLRYTAAQQTTDWGAPLNASSPIVIPEANLYQVSPPLTLRGYPLNFPEQTP